MAMKLGGDVGKENTQPESLVCPAVDGQPNGDLVSLVHLCLLAPDRCSEITALAAQVSLIANEAQH